MSRPRISDIILEWRFPELNIRTIWEYLDELGDFGWNKDTRDSSILKGGNTGEGLALTYDSLPPSASAN